MSRKLTVRVRLVHKQTRTPNEISWQYCECGCGEKFPLSELLSVKTGNEFHPYEMIHTGHLVSSVGATR